MSRVLKSLSLFVLIGVVMLRPLVRETYDAASSPLTAAIEGLADPSPLRTLVFDLLLLLAALGWLAGRMLGSGEKPVQGSTGGKPVPQESAIGWKPVPKERAGHGTCIRTGLEWGFVLVLVAGVVSCMAAGNKRPAINASIDWLCLPLLTLTLANLMTRTWHRRVLLAAILGTACVQAALCYEQYFAGFDETWAHYQSIRDDFWSAQGVDLDSPKVELFERRLQARQASGFLEHSNIAGSFLALTAMTALGVTLAGWRTRIRGPGFVAVILTSILTLVLFGAMLLTGNRGATLSVLVALVLWAGAYGLRSWLDRHRRRAFVIAWLVVLLGAGGTVGYGLRYQSLPGWSLTFRWHYWDTSADLFADHWLTGVGRENFGRHYVRYKSIDSPEEVANPHNLFVHAATEWGVLGLAGAILLPVGVSWQLSRRGLTQGRRPETGDRRNSASGLSRPTLVGWSLGLLAVVTVARLPLLGTGDVHYLYYSGITAGLFWLAGFMAVLAALRPGDASNAAQAGILANGVAAALFAFVLHEMINFAAFVPATATTAFALLAFCLAERSPQTNVAKRSGRLVQWSPVAIMSLAILVVVVIGVIPVARAGWLLARAQETGRQLVAGGIADQPADRYFRRAAAADPFDPTPPVEHARWLLALAEVPQFRAEAFDRAAEVLEAAIERDSHNVGLRRMQMELFRRKAAFTNDPRDYRTAIEAARAALRLYPLDPEGLVRLADRQVEAATATGDGAWLPEAVKNYRHALELDDARPLWAQLRRFPPRQREEIEQKIEDALRLMQPPPPQREDR